MSTIDNLDIEIKSSASQASTGIDRLVGSLNRLKGVSPSKIGLGTLANQLNRLNTALSSMTGVSKLYSLTNSLKNLSSVEKLTGLQSATKQLSKLPQIASDLEKTDIDKFAKKINEVTNAIKPLATEMEKVSNGFSALPTKIQRIIQSNEKLANSNKKASKSYGILGTGIKGWEARLGTTILKAKLIGNVIGEWITESNAYVENLNLFTVSLGKYADEAKDYAEQVAELMGIDPSEWLRAQGIFNTLATGFGIASDKASIMSKNLTQLSYDISSLYNIKVQDAMTKLQSAFSGELEPVRRLGYDLSQTKLQAIASANGIDILVSDMTQAEKSMLRYYALMTQVTVAQGDMARTLNAPANQLRIFNSQLTQLKRSLGNIFIPLLNKILPYLIAMAQVLREVANEIAKLFGFELPEIDYSSLNNLGSETSENLDDATKSAKKLKDYVMGFDELNILNKDDGSGAGNDLSGTRFDLNIPQYDFLGDLTESKTSKIAEKLKEPFKEILNLAEKIGIAILAWKVSTGVLNFANSLKGLNFSELNNLRVPAGLTIAITGLALAFEGSKSIGKSDELKLTDLIKTAVGSALGIAGSLLAFGTGALGWTIGITAVVALNILGYATGIDERLSEVVNKAFYEYTQGGLDVDVLTDYFSDLIEEVPKVNEPIRVAGEKIKTLGDNASNAKDNIEKIATALQSGIQTAEISIPILIEKFKLLAQDSKIYSDETYDNIIRGVSTSLKEALEDAGHNVPLIIKELEELKNGTKMEVEEIEKEMQKLQEKYEQGDISSEKFAEQTQILTEKLTDLAGISTPAQEAFEGVALAFEKGINFKSAEATKEALDNISNSAKTAMENIETTFATLRLNIKDANMSEELRQILLSSTYTAEEEQKAEVRTYAEQYANIIQTELIKAMDREYEALKVDYEKLNPISKFVESLNSGDDENESANYVKKGMKKYIDTTAGEIVSQIQTLYDTVGIDSKPYATETMQEIVDNLFDWDAMGGHGGGSVVVFTGDITTELNNALKEIPSATLEDAKNVGYSVVSGVSAGISGATSTLETDCESLASIPTATLRRVLDIHSPSGVTKDIGLNIVEGLANGISENTNLVETSMNNMLNSLIEKFETFTNRLRTALNNMLSDFSRSMATMSIDDEGSVSYKKIEVKSIPRFATGGFPENGLFYANSSELVGKFTNGRTAVANNEQITEGIATAVYNAMVSANQGGDNSFNIYLDGRQINASVEKVKKEKGASIMTGGLRFG